jgi:hypothetical protein
MAELKTKLTSQNAKDFLLTIEPEEKRLDSLVLLKLFEDITGEKARMWGTAIVGFGMYHYKSERSTQEGDWPLVAFSPRKQNLTLYLLREFAEAPALLDKLGKHTISKGCLYIKRLRDVDMLILTQLIEKSYQYMQAKYSRD